MAVKQGGSVPATEFEIVTTGNTSGSNFVKGVCRGIYVGGTGDVAVVDVDGNAVVFSAVPAGVILPVQAIRVNTAGTTASLMTAMF